MGSWTAFYVRDQSVEAVASCCQAWLESKRGWLSRRLSKPPAVTRGRWSDYSSDWNLGNNSSQPRRVVAYASGSWVTVLYDRFCQPNELAQFVCSTLDTCVVDTQGQTTSDAHLVEVFEAGQSLRRLDFAADEGWIEQLGSPLPGEPERLETANEDEPDDPELAWFDRSAVARYMSETFGVEWWRPPDTDDVVAFVGH